jgi:hypothetical protein
MRKNPRLRDLFGVSGRHPKQAPQNPAGDPEYEQSITRDDRRARLRRHFEAGGMTDAEIDAAMRKAKV